MTLLRKAFRKKVQMRSFLDIIVPRTCSVCGRRLGLDENAICNVCLLHLPLTHFDANPYDNEMAKVFWGRIKHFEKAFAMIYHLSHSDSAHPIYKLKYGNKPDIGIDLGLFIGRILKESGFFDDIDAILPMPLAKKRLRQRGYNQSEMIATGLHDVSRLPVLHNVVRRISFNGSQTDKGRWDRALNVDNAFELIDDTKIKGRHVLIVDDVVTTGATVCSLARQLETVDGVRISVAAIGFAGNQSSPTIDTSSKSLR